MFNQVFPYIIVADAAPIELPPEIPLLGLYSLRVRAILCNELFWMVYHLMIIPQFIESAVAPPTVCVHLRALLHVLGYRGPERPCTLIYLLRHVPGGVPASLRDAGLGFWTRPPLVATLRVAPDGVRVQNPSYAGPRGVCCMLASPFLTR